MREPSDLPIESVVDDIRAALSERRAAVVVAEPGAGKTTIVPLRLLGEPWLGDQRIVMLEPRRLAARAAAWRMASLLGESVGQTIGFTTREERRVSKETRIEVVTEGILTRRLQRDPSLAGIGLVIFDEFHERSLQGDLGLALTLDTRDGLRPDLGVLVMSATIDADRIAAHITVGEAPAPVIRAEGRVFPVDVRWQPRSRNDRLENAVVHAVSHALAEPGDVLVFLPGIGEIRRCETALGGVVGPLVDLRPLHGGLPPDEQDHAVAPSLPGRRKVVLSTDVAETSLTVDGVRVVVDAGLARKPKLDARTGMTALVTESASRASAEQRAGRAGRTAPGVAIRLWSKVEHAGRPAHRRAEITQVDLADLALEATAWGVTDPLDLPFLDQPPARAWEDAVALLRGLEAVGEDGRLTPSGAQMAELPLHPRLARMVLGAKERGTGWVGCLAAAVLTDRDLLRGRPDELPADLAIRIELLADPGKSHPAANVGAIRRARREAADIARRAGVDDAGVDLSALGQILTLGYPDRVGQRRDGTPGRFRLRSGSGAWVAKTDVLSGEDFIVAADLDGKRKDARVRLGAGLSEEDLVAVLGHQVDVHSALVWDKERNDLVHRAERRLGALRLRLVDGRPEPGDETIAALVRRIKDVGLDLLGWSADARGLQSRIEFLRSRQGEAWPAVDDRTLRATVADWLPDLVPGATGRADLERLDMAVALQTRLDWDQLVDLDRLAPAAVEIPTGRKVPLDYSQDPPVLAVRVQEMFGSTSGPRVLEGQLAVRLHLLSPADRPVQITDDLAGFWTGSWADVRKDLAGRYPKHAWPDDPTTATPHRK